MKMGYFIFGVAVVFFLTLADAYSSERHHHTVAHTTTATITNSYVQQGIALAAASGQHSYKATNQLQWSVAGAAGNNESAVSFGLAKQLGKIFGTVGFSSDGKNTMITVSGSGTF